MKSEEDSSHREDMQNNAPDYMLYAFIPARIPLS